MKFENKKFLKKKGITRIESAKRFLFVSTCICVVFGLLLIRLAYIMIYKNAEYSKMAKVQRESQFEVLADRGDILARNGSVLASTINVYRVDLDLNAIRQEVENEDANIDDITKGLSETLELDLDVVNKKLETKDENGKNASSVILVRGIEKSYADKVKELKIYGVIVSDDTKRLYPSNNYLAHTLGSVNLDNRGLNGVELQYDKYLAGMSGMRISEVDGASSQLPSNTKIVTPPIPGKDVTLTIDENIQYIIEKLASKAIKENTAKGVSIIVSNPNTGEVLGMTNKPDFDPNNILQDYERFQGGNDNEKLENMFRNSLVSDAFEPGSTFKNFTLMAAIEEGVISENDTFNCTGGTKFGDTLIKCWNTTGHGVQTLPQILQNSCNVGFMEVGKKLGKEKLNEYMTKYGFGQATNIDLPGESQGLMKEIENISLMDLATIAFGQTDTATAMQLITGFNAIANGGDLIQPHVMKEISHLNNNGDRIIDESFKPTIHKGVMSKENTSVLRDYLERTINQGGSIGTFMGKEYRIGAKTGTAEKADTVNGGYAKDKYIASVLAMYPVDKPQITLYVKVDEPSPEKYYGGQVTNSITKDFFKEVSAYIQTLAYTQIDNNTNDIVVPDIRGKSIKEANRILSDNKLEASLEGKDSIVVKMDPIPGTIVKENYRIKIFAGNKNSIESKIIIPDFTGFSLKKVDEVVSKLGITYSASGEGSVKKQSIEIGEVIEKGSKLQLELE